jgi:outer membrane biosynthesis protein TonB
MKNLKYIIVPALAAFMFTACNNEVKGPTQAEIDTQVEVKVKAATDQLKADCDSRMMQTAQMKADSILAKKASQQTENTPAPVAASKPVATTPKPKPKPTTKPTTNPTTPSTKPKDVNDRVGGNGKTNTSAPKDVNDRKGGNDNKNTEAPKNVNDRPGGN